MQTPKWIPVTEALSYKQAICQAAERPLLGMLASTLWKHNNSKVVPTVTLCS